MKKKKPNKNQIEPVIEHARVLYVCTVSINNIDRG